MMSTLSHIKHCVCSSSRYQRCILSVSLLVLFVTGFMVLSGKLTKIPFEIDYCICIACLLVFRGGKSKILLREGLVYSISILQYKTGQVKIPIRQSKPDIDLTSQTHRQKALYYLSYPLMSKSLRMLEQKGLRLDKECCSQNVSLEALSSSSTYLFSRFPQFCF